MGSIRTPVANSNEIMPQLGRVRAPTLTPNIETEQRPVQGSEDGRAVNIETY